jgi:hypothetical protein
MVAAQRLRLCAIARDNRIENCYVFVQYGLRHLRIVALNLTHDAGKPSAGP